MTSTAHRSEVALGKVACRRLATYAAPRVLIGGLGMGYTLRAVLDELPAGAKVTVAELNPITETWCRGPLAHLTDSAVNDPRVTVEIIDVASGNVTDLPTDPFGRQSATLTRLPDGRVMMTGGAGSRRGIVDFFKD